MKNVIFVIPFLYLFLSSVFISAARENVFKVSVSLSIGMHTKCVLKITFKLEIPAKGRLKVYTPFYINFVMRY